MSTSNLDKAIKDGRVIIGLKRVKKSLNNGTVSEVYLSSNGKVFRTELRLIAGEVPVKVIDETSKELGIKCKKPFNIAVIGVVKGKEIKSSSAKK